MAQPRSSKSHEVCGFVPRQFLSTTHCMCFLVNNVHASFCLLLKNMQPQVLNDDVHNMVETYGLADLHLPKRHPPPPSATWPRLPTTPLRLGKLLPHGHVQLELNRSL